ncbi:hypothetical protein NLU13_3315 [Sarocladium strictum]|uniref:Uncharacterized protein n=1 Tax=Sarocladium strictum TaxID=5046 RepID=A0AA39GPI0_SARSR|nr:hypothetical protein NLU13_3315 [Sarocladium strictum]
MAGESSATGAGEPNLNLTSEEKRAYGQLFRQADGEGVGVVTGEIAVKFFEKTRLDSRILGEIWQIADRENRGFLTPAGFGIVLRLIGHAQAGREPTPDIALQPGPLPRFDGISIAPAPIPAPLGSPPPAAHIQAQGTGGAIRIPPLTPEKASQYASLFERQPLSNNLLSGEQARTIFEKSGLPNEALGRIWQLADTEQRGALVATEFIIAMHLLTSMKTGALRALPNVLPAPLYEAATRRGSFAAPPRQSPANTGMSAIPRQLSGTAQVRAGSPLGRPPISPRTIGTTVTDWAVTPGDKAKFDQIYNDLDKANKGFITGEEAVPFFSQSNLPEDSLAQIWDLSDINSQGHLTRDEFAVAMYLIRQQRMNRGQPLPPTLPPNLIPPTMRAQARPPTATPAFEPPPMTQPPPQPKSALEDLFGLDTSPAPPAPPAPIQTTMSTGGSAANDPFAGGSSTFAPTSPIRANATGSTFKPFVPSSSFGRGLSVQPTGEGAGGNPQSASDDLLGDNDPEISKNLTGETTELANLSNQVSSLSKQMQDTQAKRSTTQYELNQTNSQKQNFEQRLAQLRTLYEKEAEDTRALEEKLRSSRAETQKLQSECMALEGNYRDIQSQHQQVLTQLQADQQENTSLREKIKVINAEIAQLKPQIDKLKSEARQQKGLVAINKKQLSTTEGERDKLKTEAEELAKGNDELSREASPAPNTSHIASPALSTGSGNNPFFRRTASTDIMGAFASPPARASTDKSFDEVFGPTTGPTTSSPPPAIAAPFKPQVTGASTASASASSMHTPSAGSPVLSRQGTLTAGGDPPAPPESRQMSSSFLPLPEHSDSLSSSRQVSPPASRAEGVGSDAKNPFPGDFPTSGSSTNDASEDKSSTPGPSETAVAPPPPTESQPAAGGSDPFANDDQAKAKADFDNAFAAFTSAKEKPAATSDSPKPPAAFASEFPPISELERDDDSESDSESGGFDDDFAPVSPKNKGKAPDAAPVAEATATEASPAPALESTPAVPPKEPIGQTAEQASSPATITNHSVQAGQTSVDDIFGTANTGAAHDAQSAAPSNPPAKSAFDDLDDEFEGLEDAKEGSADDDFANISRSGLDDFHPVFDSSPPASQAKSESTAFGNESSFDFVSAHSVSGAPAPATTNPSQQGTGEAHDWDAIFAGLDSPSTNAAAPTTEEAPTAPADKSTASRPPPPGRALTESGEHDDPILKNLTGMGYTRTDALSALEKYDYNLERAANYLASQS